MLSEGVCNRLLDASASMAAIKACWRLDLVGAAAFFGGLLGGVQEELEDDATASCGGSRSPFSFSVSNLMDGVDGRDLS